MLKISKIFFSLLVMGLLVFEALAQDMGLIQGTVKSTDGQPIPSVNVIFKNSPQKLTTLANGSFVGGMYPGKYSAFVFKLGFKTVIIDDVEVKKGLTTNFDIIFVPDPVNQGCGTIAGRITDQSDKPVPGAKIIIAESFVPKSDDIVTIEDFILKGATIETSSDQDGSFIFKKVPPGRYTAFMMNDGYQSHMHFAIYVETGQTKTIEVKLHEQKYSSIYGRVRSTDGEAIPGANVFLEGTRLGAASDASGHFLIQNVPPGKYIVNVSMVGFKPYQQSITIDKNKHQKLAVTIEPELAFKLQKKSDLQAYDVRLEELRQAYFLAESAADREQIKKQIREFLKEMFDAKEQEYAREIESKKKNIEALERLQQYRSENKADIIERRLKELLTVY